MLQASPRLCQILHTSLDVFSRKCNPPHTSPSPLYSSRTPTFADGHPERAQSCPSLCQSCDSPPPPPSEGKGWFRYSGWMLLRQAILGNKSQSENYSSSLVGMGRWEDVLAMSLHACPVLMLLSRHLLLYLAGDRDLIQWVGSAFRQSGGILLDSCAMLLPIRSKAWSELTGYQGGADHHRLPPPG